MGNYLDNLEAVVITDIENLRVAEKSYGDSWKKRGGVGAFMMLARKIDRLENQTKQKGWDVFRAIREDRRAEGVIDDIRDLRRYLILVEAEMMAQGVLIAEVVKYEKPAAPAPAENASALAVEASAMARGPGHAQPHPRGFDATLDGSSAAGTGGAQ